MLSCPVCKMPLTAVDKCYKCQNGHSFDIARQGYVNLLPFGKTQHGDDKMMASARRDFLSTDSYLLLANAICDMLGNSKRIVDIGCGECYYLEKIVKHINCDNIKAIGLDISKEILKVASPRIKQNGIVAAVANCSALPICDNSVDFALSVFAPFNESEVHRILKDGGIFVRVIPAPDHLFELKNAVYQTPYKNDNLETNLALFETEKIQNLRYIFTLNNTQQIKNLFTMTPYYYKTSPDDMLKLDSINSLDITADFFIIKYIKKSDLKI